MALENSDEQALGGTQSHQHCVLYTAVCVGLCAAGQPLLDVAQQLAQGHAVFQQGHQQISQAIALSSHPHLTAASMPGPSSGAQISSQASKASLSC